MNIYHFIKQINDILRYIRIEQEGLISNAECIGLLSMEANKFSERTRSLEQGTLILPTKRKAFEARMAAEKLAFAGLKIAEEIQELKNLYHHIIELGEQFLREANPHLPTAPRMADRIVQMFNYIAEHFNKALAMMETISDRWVDEEMSFFLALAHQLLEVMYASKFDINELFKIVKTLQQFADLRGELPVYQHGDESCSQSVCTAGSGLGSSRLVATNCDNEGVAPTQFTGYYF